MGALCPAVGVGARAATPITYSSEAYFRRTGPVDAGRRTLISGTHVFIRTTHVEADSAEKHGIQTRIDKTTPAPVRRPS